MSFQKIIIGNSLNELKKIIENRCKINQTRLEV